MKNKVVIGLVILFSVFLITMTGPTSTQAQISTPTPTIPTSEVTPESETTDIELEKRVFQLETTQEQYIKALNETSERYKLLLTGLSGLLTAIILAGGIFQVIVTRIQAERENRQDEIQYRGAQQVSEIMSVVKDTLESRLDAEIQAREEARLSREQLDALGQQVSSLDIFFKNFQKNIQNARQDIEEKASRLVQTPRHEFKPIANDLINFAQQFDTFNTEYKLLEAESASKFSMKVFYLRGVAALYANQPEIAKQYLVAVTEFIQPEPGDLENAFKRRLANAHYYIGIIESNFGNIRAAVDSFEQSNILDPDVSDFLTRVVTAEAYVMSSINEFSKAVEFLDEIDNELNKRRKSGRLNSTLLRIKSRASLIRSNMVILKREEGWQKESEKLLVPIYQEDPAYYYATYSLAQIYALQNNHDDAENLFRKAYETIERSGDLFITREARSLILIYTVAGLCCRHGLMDEKRSDDLLDKADSLRSILPRIDSQTCTVFSALSKFNERSETIHDHIELIRKGEVLFDRATRAM